MKVKTRKWSTYTVECDNEREFEVQFEPIGDVHVAQLPNGYAVVGYLACDMDCANPLEDCDGMGAIHDRRRRHGSTESIEKFYEALGYDRYGDKDPDSKPDPYAVLLDTYEHGQTAWSVHGGGMQCQWDTTSEAGVWVPDDYCREHIHYSAMKALLPDGCRAEYAYDYETGKNKIVAHTPAGKVERRTYKSFVTAMRAVARIIGFKFDKEKLEQAAREEAIKCAKQACDAFSDWGNGVCYGVCVEVFDGDGGQVAEDTCWGYIGSEHAEESLKMEFDATVREWEKKVVEG